MSLQMATFHSVLWRRNSPLRVYRLPCWLSGKESTAMQETQERQVQEDPHGGGPLQYSCLGFSRQDREAWQATVHRATKSQTGLKQLSMHARVCVCVCVCIYEK